MKDNYHRGLYCTWGGCPLYEGGQIACSYTRDSSLGYTVTFHKPRSCERCSRFEAEDPLAYIVALAKYKRHKKPRRTARRNHE